MSFLSAPVNGDANTDLSPESSPGGAGLVVGDATPAAPAPLVDPAALQELGVQLDSAAVAKGFARDYANMWDQRYDSIASAVNRCDQAAALDAVLSLKTSSTMVGGVQLAQLAGELEDAVRDGHMDQAHSMLDDVAERGSETVDELQFGYVLRDSTAPHPRNQATGD
ncbi:Hpt domain-containing protein [Arthrobacter sp. CG_A4]|uniref:Hpt domain-containing protein n=1 Tax=Arthrobacter sp. CG_A4 TaxID=3071706 RepID=UPI002E0291AE|nr:HPt (histidine-containing phosphotransfer) domain-containing protein [Arthrobacter sp. CG_A4]